MSARSVMLFLILCLTPIRATFAQNYPDQSYVLRVDSLYQNIETNEGLALSSDGKCLMLQQDRTNGYLIVKPQYSSSPFNRGLPSWNGSAPDDSSSFKVQMRFPYGAGWSSWLTVGFWKANVWSSYGATSYAGGYIDYDNAVLSSYVGAWQFKVIMTRTAVDHASPTIHTLSFFVSDSRTTSSADFSQIVNDKPGAILIPTDFIYQYGVDPVIGGSICSPTSVSMILRSYSIAVDPLQFARDTRDPYFDMFGIWPRVVQNASEYGLDGTVTRYRTWSQARDVLADGGRIAMSIGEPLYTGHLVMLAGFNANGDPIVHDPARSNGYSYVYNKSDLSHSWYDKGGVGYTFFPAEIHTASVQQLPGKEPLAHGFQLFQNYPNPFNPMTKIQFTIVNRQWTIVKVFDLMGREVATLVNEVKVPGTYTVQFDGSNLTSGAYFYRLTAGDFVATKRFVLLK